MGELVDQRHGRPTARHGLEVHLLEHGAAVLDRLPGNDLEIAELRQRVATTVGLHVADDHVGASLSTTPALVEHGERLADAGSSPEVDAQQTSGHA